MTDDSMCVEDCKYDGTSKYTLIRCCSCMRWFHDKCLNVAKEDIKGIWACTICRQIPSKIDEILNFTKTLATDFTKLSKTLLDRDTELIMKERRLEEADQTIAMLQNRVKLLEFKLQDTVLHYTQDLKSNVNFKDSEENKTDAVMDPPNYADVVINSTQVPQFDNNELPAELGKYINRENQGIPARTSDWQTVQNQKHKSQSKPAPMSASMKKQLPPTTLPSKSIAGNRRTNVLAAAPRLTTVRATNFDLQTEPDTVSSYVSDFLDIDVALVHVERLPPPPHITVPRYTCFSITVPFAYNEKIFTEDLWPHGIFVKRMSNRHKIKNGGSNTNNQM